MVIIGFLILLFVAVSAYKIGYFLGQDDLTKDSGDIV